MAGEDVSESPTEVGDSLEGWLDAKAEELEVSREELLARLRNGDAPGGADPDASGDSDAPEDDLGGFDDLRREVAKQVEASREEFEADYETLEASHEDLEADLAEARAAFDEKIDDVRERVVQIKRETDEKAPADHDHPELAAADRADDLAAELESLSETVAELDERVETGFDNYEDVLEYLTDATDDVETKLTTLAEATVDLRERTKVLAARHATRAAADELAHLANRRGIERADCGHCGQTVRVGLLASPKCPHCASTFNDVERKQRFFGSHTLVVGDPPALEGERADWDVESVLAAESPDHAAALDDILEDDE